MCEGPWLYPSTLKERQKNLYESEVSMAYIMSFRVIYIVRACLKMKKSFKKKIHNKISLNELKDTEMVEM